MTKLFVTDEERIPAWVDMSRLRAETCLSRDTVYKWIKERGFPPGVLHGGKRMWKWTEVEAYLEHGKQRVRVSTDPTPQEIAHATQKALHAR